MKEKRKRKKNSKTILYIVPALIMLYVIYAIYLLLKQPTKKVTVEEGALHMQETNIGYIIRDEIVITGDNYKNGMEQIKNEGEKTAKGDSIFRYYTRSEEQLKKQVSNLDIQIQEVLKGQNNLFSSDAKLLENQLDEKIENLSKITDVSKINEYQKQINDLITRKSKIYGEASASGSYLKELYNQRAELENQINSGSEYIKAEKSGIVSYKVDGLENILTPNNFSELSKNLLHNLNLKTGQLIATSSESGKIIDSEKCYIATISESKEALDAEVGQKIKIRLSNNKLITSTISYIKDESYNQKILVIEIDKEISELANYRKISLELIWWSDKGLKVPNHAIAEENGINYVVRNKAGYQSKIPVKIKRANDKYSIVSNYNIEELKELGIIENAINNVKKISIYDELVLYPDITKIE